MAREMDKVEAAGEPCPCGGNASSAEILNNGFSLEFDHVVGMKILMFGWRSL